MTNKNLLYLKLKPFKMIFLIKLGKKITINNDKKCYQVHKLISFIFHLYYSGIFLFVFFLIFHHIDILIKDNNIAILLSFILYMILEIIVTLILPLKQVNCNKD